MSNWGSSKKSTPASRSGSSKGSASSRSKPATSKTAHRSPLVQVGVLQGRDIEIGRRPSRLGRAATCATPPRPTSTASRRTRANTEMREAVAGREHEFLGLGLIGLGVLLGLAIYVNLAGPLGRGIETLFGWLAGLGPLRHSGRPRRDRRVAGPPRRARRARSGSPSAGPWSAVRLLGSAPDRARAGRADHRDRAARRGRRVARRAHRRSARSAARPGRGRRGARARPDRRCAADHPDLDAHHGVAHRRVPRDHR